MDTQCVQQYRFLTGRPMADPYTSILRPRRYVCLPPASFERPVSDRHPRRPLCDCFEQSNFTGTMVSMPRSERPLCHPFNTLRTRQMAAIFQTTFSNAFP